LKSFLQFGLKWLQNTIMWRLKRKLWASSLENFLFQLDSLQKWEFEAMRIALSSLTSYSIDACDEFMETSSSIGAWLSTRSRFNSSFWSKLFSVQKRISRMIRRSKKQCFTG
jgi:hypothetical protein